MQANQTSSTLAATAADGDGPVPTELDRLFMLSPAMLCIARTDGYFKRVNPAFHQTLGHTEAVLLSRPFIDFVHPDDQQDTRVEVRSLSKGNPPLNFENRFRHADGSYRWLLWNATSSIEDGLLYATAFDITDRKRADQMFRGLLEAAPDALIIADDLGKVLTINRATEILFGYRTNELVGQSIHVLVPHRLRDKHREHLNVYAKDPRSRVMGGGVTLSAVRKDGSEFPAEISLGPMETELGSLIICAVRDSSLRIEQARELTDSGIALKQASLALLRGEQRLRVIVEAMPVPVVITRIADGEIVLVNAMMSNFFDVSDSELLGRKARDLYEDPVDGDILLGMVSKDKSVDRHEVRLKRLDGTPIWAQLSMRPIEFDDERTVLTVVHDITHLKEMNEAANRFVPQDYLRVLDKDNIIDISLGDHVRGEMTVMFADLRNFTTVSEAMTPKENFAFVNEYLGRVSPVVRNHDGLIIKYLGDGIHAIFPGLADDGVQAGIEMLEEVNAYNKYRCSLDRLPIAVGIGVNTGSLMLGMVGEQERMQGDCISDEVNLAARIEGMTKFYDVNFIVSGATYNRLSDPNRHDIRYLDKAQVLGRATALDLYEVYDADPPQMRALKQETQVEYEQAIELYYTRDFDAAQAKLINVLQRNPRDKAAWRFLVNATQMAQNGSSGNWSGVTVMEGK
jgi:PAS domain S-box-containing protein